MAICTALYGGENWVLAEKNTNIIKGTEVRFSRSNLGVTRQDMLSNEAIRKA
jgi:hypothetical protein